MVLRDGTVKHLHHLAQAVFGPDGRSLKYVGTIHDITDRRRAEDEARVLQERLTHFSRLSTMGEMAAGLAHEINQPLSAIATYAQACQRLIRQPDHEIEDVLAALEQINAQALRAGEVIRRLRNFVKNREVKREPVNCARLLEDLSTLAETDARLHNIRLRLDCEEPLPTVYADPIQLQQVILNLVRNAIDAMSEAPEDRREVVLTTRDGGRRRGRDHRRRPRHRPRARGHRAPVQPVLHDQGQRHRASVSPSAAPSCAPTAGACGTLPTMAAAYGFTSRCRCPRR